MKDVKPKIPSKLQARSSEVNINSKGKLEWINGISTYNGSMSLSISKLLTPSK